MDDPVKPESLFRRFLLKNSGLLCLVTLLTLPIILGVAIGYVIVLAVVTSYKKIRGDKTREEKENEAKQKIRIILGHNLLESAFTKPVKTHGHPNLRNVAPLPQYGSIYENELFSNDGIESEEDSRCNEVPKPEETKEEQAIQEDHVVDEAARAKPDVLVASSASADPDSSRTASASSEYYSTASEMEEQNVPLPQASEQGKTVSDPPGVKDTTLEVTQESTEVPVKPGLSNRGCVPEEAPCVIPRDVVSSKASTSLGKLKYSIKYIEHGNQLQVTIIKGINISVLNSDITPSTYVKVSLLPQRFCWQRTKVVESWNPVFNETFVISGFSHEKIGAYTLLIVLVNAVSQWQGYYGDHVIGEVYVPLSHVIKHANSEGKAMSEWSELRPKLSEIPGLSKHGKINLSLCYRPISGRLIVTIKKARDLKCENKETFDPYVKLALYCDGTRVGRGATRVKRKVSNPVFSEKFNFDLTSDQIAYTTIVIKVLNNVESSRTCLGATVIGYESSGDGQEHWLCMMECLSQHVDAWHSLYS